ncbi:hypothetical protein [Sinomicrobium oceani]|uniref:hypothetical protein n=1 Tax=Sinomicrobium oceani TaxID=1150368 RepID=UPI00227B3447|nr:hypothetical protein [Sinomicrobium oceani]
MKQINIDLYTIDELSPEVQQRVYEQYREFNVEGDDWFDSVLNDFCALCKTIGIHIPHDGIAFSRFWPRHDGSSFTSTIDIVQLIKTMAAQVWKSHAPRLQFNVPCCPCDHRVIRQIERETIFCDMITTVPSQGYWTAYQARHEPGTSSYPNIGRELHRLDTWVKDVMETLNRYLYTSIWEAYEYNTSNQALKEAFQKGEYWFTKDGEMIDRILLSHLEKQ